jgi:TolB-like protein
MRATCVLIIIFIFSGCAGQETVHIKDGKEYGVTRGLFRDRFWNYYERGVSFTEGEYYDEAARDFLTGIEKRSEDQWRSRTYGMHFVDYFPHRELGVVYFKTKKYHDAEQELEASLKTAESAKAKYYLNEVRRAILQETGADREMPELKISSPPDGIITNKFSLTISGKAEDDQFVSSVLVNVTPLPLELSSKKVPFEKEVALAKGMNEIKVEATDLTGKTTEKLIKVNVDRDGPVIIIEDQKIDGRKAVVSGYLSDSSGITSFIINDKKIPVQELIALDSERELEFHEKVDIPQGTDTIILKVEDHAENVTTGELNINSDHADVQHSMPDMHNGYPLLAASFPEDVDYAFVGSGLGKIIDNIPPVIHFKDLVDFQTVYDDIIYLEGSVSDSSRVTSLVINGISILKRKGKKVFFNFLSKLNEGGNRFFVEATDTFGNSVEKIVAVKREIPKVRQIGSRMSITVLPMERKGEQSVAGDAISDSLISAFVNQKRFNVIERDKLDEVMRELKLSQTKLVDQDTAIKVGKILVADTVLTGTIYESKDSIEILSRLVDTETSSVIEVKDVFDEDKGLRSVNRLMEGLALKYKQSFPLLEGYVIKKEGHSVLIDLGSDKKVKKDMGVILFREGEEVRHPVSGKYLGSEPVELGEAKINNVYKEFSRAVIRKGRSADIRMADQIITK